MTKKELIRELESLGCFDVNIAWPKKDLEEKLNNVKAAKSMSHADLLARFMNKEVK